MNQILRQIKTETQTRLLSSDLDYAVGASFSLVSGSHVLVCAIGSGSKAVGMKDLNVHTIHNCHAEVIARRTFLVWILDTLMDESQRVVYFDFNNGKYSLKQAYKLIMYVTQPPCGECSLQKDSQIYGLSAARPFSLFNEVSDSVIIDSKRLRSTPTNSRTPIEQRCPSFCCSDKIMFWSVLGVQGAMLNLILEPIYISYLLIDYRDNFRLSKSIDIRARTERDSSEISKIELLKNNQLVKKRISKFKVRSIKCIYGRKNHFIRSPFNESNDKLTNKRISGLENIKFQSYSISILPNHTEKINSVTGLKWGVAKKDLKNVKLLPKITKIKLYEQFKNLCQNLKLGKLTDGKSYHQVKESNYRYKAQKFRIQSLFSEWSPSKKEFEQFE